MGASAGHGKRCYRDRFEFLHSLKVIVMVSRVHKVLEVELPLTEVFKRKSIRGLAGYIETVKKSKYIGIRPMEAREYYELSSAQKRLYFLKREYYELSSAQKRLYFLNRMDVERTTYNMPFFLSLGKNIEINRLEATLKRLIARHESLRTSFERVNEEPVQRIHAPGEIEFAGESYQVEVEDEVKAAEIINNFIRPFDLSRAPLIRSGIIRCIDGNYIWMLDMHHIISDGTSNVILTREFMLLYNDNGEELETLRLQ
jgi:tyrocidine synthetase-3